MGDKRMIAVVNARWAALRTPFLPIDALLGLNESRLEDYEARVSSGRERLRALVQRSDVRDALFVASPSLDPSIDYWLGAADTPRGLRIERTLMRYVSRMASRSTPFGLFAGCSTATVGTSTEFRLGPSAEYGRHSRPDHDYLAAIRYFVSVQPDVRMALRYFPNSSLTLLAGRLRYSEVHFSGAGRSYRLVAVTVTEYLQRTLDRAADGATIDELAAALVADDSDVGHDEATDYVLELVDSQVLVSELTPSVTGGASADEMVARLRNIPATKDIATALGRALKDLHDIDASGVGVPVSRYIKIADELGTLPVKPVISRLFQVDMTKPAVATIGRDVLAKIAAGVDGLRAMCPRWSDPMKRFAEKFSTRYERESVPLLEVLDEESGIGFERPAEDPQELLDGIRFPSDQPMSSEFARREEFLLAKLEHCWRRRDREIELTPADLSSFDRSRWPGLPNAYAVHCVLGRQSDSGTSYVWIRGVSGPSGARMLGRFCHCDPVLEGLVQGHLRDEEDLNKDAIFAEIVHVPEGRLGNIQARPVLRPYEIPYLCRSSVPASHQIDVSDLLVSVSNDRVRLWSRRLNREVIPRLSTAHNFRRGLGVYAFLCALQSQGAPEGLSWTWGALGQSAFLPRVSVNGAVLSRATWNVRSDVLKAWGSLSRAQAFDAVQRWRETNGVPRWIASVDSDNELTIDLDSVLSVDTFVDLVSELPSAQVVEMLPAPDELCVSGPEGSFAHELVVPVLNVQAASPPAAVRPSAPVARRESVSRRLGPGSEWLFLKWYVGTGTADWMLRNQLGALVADLRALKLIDGWFFVRYQDPDFHLRVRFHGRPDTLMSQVLPRIEAMSRTLLDERIVWRWQLDTYVREVERYGGPHAVDLAEAIFEADSDAAVALLADEPDSHAGRRWRLALVSFDHMLRDMGFSDLEIRSALQAICATHGRQYVGNKPLTRSLGDRFRRERSTLERLLGGDVPDYIRDAFTARSQRTRPLFAQLKDLHSKGLVAASVGSHAVTYLHMNANRLLRSSSMRHEHVLYDFLARLYESKLARAKALARD